MICGIYSITHLASGRFYIGHSADIYRRWQSHFSGLKLGNHANSKLQKIWTEEGETALIFAIEIECSEGVRFEIEHKLIKAFPRHVLLNERFSHWKPTSKRRPKKENKPNTLYKPVVLSSGATYPSIRAFARALGYAGPAGLREHLLKGRSFDEIAARRGK